MFDKAEKIYKEILILDKNDFYALIFLGCLKRKKGFFSEGISLIERALKINPNSSIAYYNLGNVFRDLSDWEKAINAYSLCLNIKPNDA